MFQLTQSKLKCINVISMIGKEVLEEKPVTLAEVRQVLNKIKKEGELTYEQKVSLDYANEFGKAAVSKVHEALKKLNAEEIDDKIAVKILDIMPKTKEELGLIFEKVRFDLTEAKIKKY